MPRLPRLTVVVPDFTDASASSRLDPFYARLAGRGSVLRTWAAHDVESGRLPSWQRGLLTALQLEERSHPSAPLIACGAGFDLERTWLHVELVHFAAGLNDVALVPLKGEHAVSAAERAALLTTLRAHVESTSATLETTARGECLLGMSGRLDVQTVTPQFARTHDWNVALPRGKDAGLLRRLMTELQMLLHEHPVNDARAARGMPAANAVWLWGNGEVGRGARASSIHIGDNEYFAGVCRYENWSAPRALAEAEQVLAEIDSNSDVVIALSADTSVETQLQVAALGEQALRAGRCRTLDFVLDEWHLSVDRWALRKFWRAPRSIEHWAHA